VKKLQATLITVSLTAALSACGGSDDGEIEQQILEPENTVTLAPLNDVVIGSAVSETRIVSDDLSDSGGQSLLLDGSAVSSSDYDLSISNVSVDDGENTIQYQFTVTDAGGAEIPLDSLSVALEVAATGSFADSYTIPLFDIREDDNSSDENNLLTARSAATQLPSGSYIARLVVNPNWQHAFDIVPAGSDARPFHYLQERDYSNNASGTFQLPVAGGYTCDEDGFEDNDSVSTAAVIPTGGQISASLCLDDVDYYSVILSESESASLTFDYTDAQSNPNPTTRYVVLDPGFNRVTEPTVARESNRIVINGDSTGQYYLVLFGNRSSYRITRSGGTGFQDDDSNDNLFHADTVVGPNSWLFGDVVLNRLALSEVLLADQTVNCNRIATQFSEDQPVAYVTPLHFAEIHEFRFLADGSYLIDGEETQGWRIVDGDISNRDWYDNGFPGYAQKVSDNEWRYWSEDGLAYAECTLEINR